MRVAVLLARFFPSGQTVHAVELAAALRRAGHEVTFIQTQATGSDPCLRGHFLGVLHGAGVPVLGPERVSGPPAGLPPVDVVHAHSALDFGRAASLSGQLAAPYVLTIHGVGLREYNAAAFIPGAAAVVAVERRVAEDIRGLNAATVVIENGVDTTRLCPPEEAEEDDQGRGRAAGGVHPFRIVYAGRIDSWKRPGFRELVTAAALLSRSHPVRLTVLSTAPPPVPGGLPRTAADLVDYRGWLPNPAEVFRRADLIVGVDRVIREGMAAGRPCAVLGRSYSGLVVPAALDPQAGHDFGGRGRSPPEAGTILIDLLRLVTRPELARRLGREGREYAVRHFSLEQSARKTVELYEKVVGGLAPGGRLRRD
ncbi:MAG: glycosyltransferase family 4 protein [Bacillota bacterium]